MALEIERKFVVRDPGVIRGHLGARIVQGYIVDEPMTVRVRIREAESFLTLKTRVSEIAHEEYEFPIPMHHARELLARHCGDRVIEKTRYRIPHDEVVVEVDVFAGRHAGLMVAEIELDHPGQQVRLPEWLGAEITSDHRFSNSALAMSPQVPLPDC